MTELAMKKSIVTDKKDGFHYDETRHEGTLISREKMPGQNTPVKSRPKSRPKVAVGEKKEKASVETFKTFNKRPLPKRANDLTSKAIDVALDVTVTANNGESSELWSTVDKIVKQVEKTWEYEDTFKRWWADRLIDELSLYIWNNIPKGQGKHTDRAADEAYEKFRKIYN